MLGFREISGECDDIGLDLTVNLPTVPVLIHFIFYFTYYFFSMRADTAAGIYIKYVWGSFVVLYYASLPQERIGFIGMSVNI